MKKSQRPQQKHEREHKKERAGSRKGKTTLRKEESRLPRLEERRPVLHDKSSRHESSTRHASLPPIRRSTSSSDSADSKGNFRSTCYLIFPVVGAKTAAVEKPILIRFPEDVVSPAPSEVGEKTESRMDKELKVLQIQYCLIEEYCLIKYYADSRTYAVY